MRGFTLVEILVSGVILGFLFAAIYGVLNIGNIVYKDDITLLELQQQVRQAMSTMVKEIRESKSSEITIQNNEITFKIPAEEYANPWVGPITYYRDVNDTNNDGVVNQIIREYPAGTRKILANEITALSFSLTGDVVRIELAAKKASRGIDLCFPSPCANPQKTLKETIRLRNE
jgi:prepilin-type N-terminal cleavage/methylation domain-containing protein